MIMSTDSGLKNKYASANPSMSLNNLKTSNQQYTDDMHITAPDPSPKNNL